MHTRRWLAVTTVAAVALAAPGRAQAPRPATGSAYVVGQVVDGVSGRPVAGATVTLRGGPGRNAPAVITAADGYFLFRDLPAGRFTASATKTGYVASNAGQRRPAGAWRPLDVDDGQHVGPVQIRMWRQGAVAGTVLDDAGEPLVGAEILVLRLAVRAGYRSFATVGRSVTDDRGFYRVGGLTPGAYTVMMPGRRIGSERPLRQESNRVSEIITLDGSRPARVVVPEAPSEPSRIFPTTFYPDGTDTAGAQVLQVTGGDEITGVDVRVAPSTAYAVSGRVSLAGQRVGRARVELAPEGPAEPRLRDPGLMTRTQPDGSFLFPAAGPGVYRVRAALGPQGNPGADPLWWAEASVSVGAGAIHDLELELQPGLTIRGRILFEDDAPAGAPAPDLTRIPIVIESLEPPGLAGLPNESVRATAAGEFASTEHLPGRYRVRVTGSPPGWMFKAAYARGIDISDYPLDLRLADENDVLITFTSRWNGIKGTVRAPDGQPDPGATVVIFPRGTDRWSGEDWSLRRFRSTLVRGDGSWSVTSLPSGDYYVAAIPESESDGWNDPDVLLGLTRFATEVTIRDGEQPTVALRTQVVR